MYGLTGAHRTHITSSVFGAYWPSVQVSTKNIFVNKNSILCSFAYATVKSGPFVLRITIRYSLTRCLSPPLLCMTLTTPVVQLVQCLSLLDDAEVLHYIKAVSGWPSAHTNNRSLDHCSLNSDGHLVGSRSTRSVGDRSLREMNIQQRRAPSFSSSTVEQIEDPGSKASLWMWCDRGIRSTSRTWTWNLDGWCSVNLVIHRRASPRFSCAQLASVPCPCVLGAAVSARAAVLPDEREERRRRKVWWKRRCFKLCSQRFQLPFFNLYPKPSAWIVVLVGTGLGFDLFGQRGAKTMPMTDG
jgi:hypothetical protein